MRRRSLWFGLSLLAVVAVAGAVHLWASGSVSTQIVLKVNATGTKTVGLASIQDPLVEDYTQLLASGTGANQASNLYHAQRTLVASASEDLDLAGTLTNAFGVTLTFTKVKALIIHAATGNTNDVQVGGGGVNSFVNWVADASDIVNVKPGGTLILVAPNAAGYAVTAGTGDLLHITNSAGTTSVTYDVIVIGVD